MQALVVDDSKAMRLILSKFLSDLGFTVEQSPDGFDALKKLQVMVGTFDAVLTLVDWNMPKMDGLELVRAVRSNAQFDVVTIMMVTTESTTARMVEALDAGADEYLMKPFTRDAMRSKLHTLGLVGPEHLVA